MSKCPQCHDKSIVMGGRTNGVSHEESLPVKEHQMRGLYRLVKMATGVIQIESMMSYQLTYLKMEIK